MLDALQNVIRTEAVSLTEAVRRLIGYRDFVYRSAKQDKAREKHRNGIHRLAAARWARGSVAASRGMVWA